MMDKELIEALRPLEEEFEVDLFTFDEALEFYKSDIESFKSYTKKIIEELKTLPLNDFLKGSIAALEQSIASVEAIFGGRVEGGF